jgi:peptidoglycan/LPS O-acetylase OafA/YrhL
MTDQADRTDDLTPADAALTPKQADGVRLADSRRLSYINTCRGLAILMVILVHHSESFTYNFYIRYIAAYGQMGVQLFFIASALTLCFSMDVRRYQRNPVLSFYLRRFFRIAPLYYVGIAVYAAMAAAPFLTGFNGQWPLYSRGNVIANLLLVHGFRPSAYNGIVPGGWSVGTEVAFYLIFPALFVGYVRAYRTWGTGFLLLAPVAAFALDVMVQPMLSARGLPVTNGSFLYCNILNQLSVFLIGMSGFFAIRDGLLDRVGPSAKIAGFVVLSLGSIVLLGVATPLALTLLQPMAGLSFLLLLDVLRSLVTRERLIERIGEVSYSMYVFHFLFAWTATRMILHGLSHIPHGLMLLYLPTLLGTIAASYGVGTLSKAVLEDPFIRAGKWVIARCNGMAPVQQEPA